ncbi:hypothetical protein JOB18_046212 [Solea senegalensis]|uniref:Fibronectin type III domain-containing protein 10 n=2 Tax=Solea senegalensis TaxID=28829 RepID=A0AAV6QSI7_SOLSE|nr:hypothetical protein JOB18_046212 [Solea senegalensis]
MKSQQPSVLVLTALLLCTLHQTTAAAAAAAGSGRSHHGRSASSSSSSSTAASTAEVMTSRDTVETLHGWLKHTNTTTNNYKSRTPPPPPPKLEEAPEHESSFSFNTSRGNDTTVTPERSGTSWSSEEDESSSSPPPSSSSSSHCAYRVFEGGIGGQLCFRNTLPGYKCHKADCRTVVSLGNLVANILINGSVLLQWSHEGGSTVAAHAVKRVARAGDAGTKTPGSNTVFSSPHRKRGGYELSCWWNGSFTQFECAGVHLGSSCRDFLLTELHENIPYRLCLRSLASSGPAQSAGRRDCVEFTLPLSGMQDIVIAMTTVGGAICVMLVIICLLVAYITENIMSPATQHSYSYRTHSCH